jgi:endonuclease/exonuclease/phosphatase (EEP) superfamily protein YafD
VAIDRRAGLTLAAAAAVMGSAVLHLGRPLRLRSRAAVSAVALAPVSLVPATAGVVMLGLLRHRAVACAGAAALGGCAATHAGAFRRTPADRRRRPDVELTVMAANLLHGKADPDALVRVATDHGVDVLCVQEVHQEALDAIADRLSGQLPHHHTLPGTQGAGAGIFSRFPLTDPRTPEGYGFPPVLADVHVPIDRPPGSRTLTVLSFHSKAPLGNGGAHLWSDDLARVGRLMRQHPGSLIVAGDFNATRDHRQFRDLLGGGYSDAADDAGAGLLPTFPAKRRRIPIARLDHVLVGRGLIGVAAVGAPIRGSDHRAVIARIAAR